MRLENKHIFVISSADKFCFLNLDALIHKCGILPSNLAVIVFPIQGQPLSELLKIDNVDYYEFDDVTLEEIKLAQTITFMSLNRFNSPYARKIIEFDEGMARKSYIFITDDEVDRWNQCHSKFGKLVPYKKLHIVEDDIVCLNRINNFIADRSTFESTLQRTLNRKKVNFINASVIFDTLPYNASKSLESAFNCSDQHYEREAKVLLGTKQHALSYSELREVVNGFVKAENAERYKFLILWNKKRRKERVMFDLYITYLRHIKRQTIDVSYVTALSPIAYTSLILSCSHMVLQRRGGASTARLFLKRGRGMVYTLENSENDFGFRKALGIKTKSFTSFSDIGKLVSNLNDDADIEHNIKICESVEQRDVSNLQKLYSN
ncbi:hypothetical protein [Vibrio hangzhouensis]|uniref:Uncharacterized protein n=1 Tax=Vibrio hangzhouensis TaxID=462991 RepID=A0A1H6CA15_9VIBR|nr:hypothetical protein [Vibrio hangzhouensis]SEG69800.1 hypothetical protein SAMN04488244_1348 [Vibrio hangzhouensis]